MSRISNRVSNLERRTNGKDVPLVFLSGFCDDTVKTADGIKAASIIGRQPPAIYRRDFETDEDFYTEAEKEHERLHGPVSLTVNVLERRQRCH